MNVFAVDKSYKEEKVPSILTCFVEKPVDETAIVTTDSSVIYLFELEDYVKIKPYINFISPGSDEIGTKPFLIPIYSSLQSDNRVLGNISNTQAAPGYYIPFCAALFSYNANQGIALYNNDGVIWYGSMSQNSVSQGNHTMSFYTTDTIGVNLLPGTYLLRKNGGYIFGIQPPLLALIVNALMYIGKSSITINDVSIDIQVNENYEIEFITHGTITASDTITINAIFT